jgi:O-succinylbenzoate synthase
VRTPDVAELLDASYVVRLPMRVPFRGVSEREALLLRGPAGFGEFAPFTEYGDAEAAWWLTSAVEAAWQGFPPPLRPTVAVNATVPAVPPQDVAGVLAVFDGCTTAKVKVAEPGQTLADDLARVREVRRLLGPGGRIRIDANGSWDVGQARAALAALAPSSLEYAEQPCASLGELQALRAALTADGVHVRVAADESIRKADDPFAVAATGSVDVAVVKVAPLGGVRRMLAVAEVLAKRHGVEVVVSSALDTSVGIAAGLAAAAALPTEPPACGLATAGLLAADVTHRPLLPAGGRLPAGPVDADPDLLARYAAPADRRDWWLARLTRCHALLADRAGSRA